MLTLIRRRSDRRRPSPLSLGIAATVTASLVAGLCLVWPSAPDAGEAAADTSALTLNNGDVVLETDTPLAGREAIDTLRSTPTQSDPEVPALDTVAERYGLTVDELTARLERDSTLQVDSDGLLLYADTFDPSDIDGHGHEHEHAVPEPQKPGDPAELVTSGGTSASSTDIAPLNQTFSLHSRPGSRTVIYLDFNGHRFNEYNGWGSHLNIFYRGWDPAGDGSEIFSPDELRRIQQVWSEVAQNYAAFDVNVTTQEPGPDALRRTSASDPTYGHRAVISSHRDIISGGDSGLDPGIGNSAPASGTVGLAHINTFGGLNWEYASLNSGGAGSLSWVVTHEVGHSLGLNHTMDRTGYPGAGTFSNHMDYVVMPQQIFDAPDRAVITQNMGSGGPRVHFAADGRDWHSAVAQGLDPAALSPDTPLALPLPAGGRVQSTLSGHVNGANPNGDTDTYRLEGCTHLTAYATVTHPHNKSLDLALDLSTHPSSVPGDEHHLMTRANAGALGSGSEAFLREEVNPDDTLYLTVRGATGTGLDDAPSDDVLTKYFDGASSGDYTLQVTGCEGTPALHEPRALKGHTSVDGSTTLTWENDPALHTELIVDGRRPVVLAPGVTSHTVTTKPDTVAAFRVRAVDPQASAEATSPWVSGRTTLDLAAPLRVSVTSDGLFTLRLHPDRPATEARYFVGTSLTDPPKTTYFRSSGRNAGTHFDMKVTATYTPVGRQDFIVLTGVSGDSYSIPYTVTAPRQGAATVPSAPTSASWTFHEGTSSAPERASHTVTWEPPTSDGGSEILEYRLHVGGQVISVDASARSHTIHDVHIGASGSVFAVNAAGRSPSAPLAGLTEVDATPLPLAPPQEVELREDSQGSHLDWKAPAEVPTRSITGWLVTVGGRSVTLPPRQRTLNLTGMRTERTTRVSLALLGPDGSASDPVTVAIAPGAN